MPTPPIRPAIILGGSPRLEEDYNTVMYHLRYATCEMFHTFDVNGHGAELGIPADFLVFTDNIKSHRHRSNEARWLYDLATSGRYEVITTRGFGCVLPGWWNRHPQPTNSGQFAIKYACKSARAYHHIFLCGFDPDDEMWSFWRWPEFLASLARCQQRLRPPHNRRIDKWIREEEYDHDI